MRWEWKKKKIEEKKRWDENEERIREKVTRNKN